MTGQRERAQCGKGDKRRVEDIRRVRANFELIKKPCGCTFGEKCRPQCKNK